MIESKCPSCGRALTVPDGLAGKTGRCPLCGRALCVPDLHPHNEPDQGSPNPAIPASSVARTGKGGPAVLVWGACAGCVLLIAVVAATLFWPNQETPPQVPAHNTPQQQLANISEPVPKSPEPKPKPEPKVEPKPEPRVAEKPSGDAANTKPTKPVLASDTAAERFQ